MIFFGGPGGPGGHPEKISKNFGPTGTTKYGVTREIGKLTKCDIKCDIKRYVTEKKNTTIGVIGFGELRSASTKKT